MEKAKVTTVTEYYGEDWGDGCSMSGENITFTHGKESFNYDVSEGEPEDMIFGRNLEDTYSILQMIRLAYKLGKEGVDIEFEDIEERD